MTDGQHWVKRTRAEQLADDLDGLAIVYSAERVGLSNRERLRLIHAAANLVTELVKPEWSIEPE